jgi:hypothetical protein
MVAMQKTKENSMRLLRHFMLLGLSTIMLLGCAGMGLSSSELDQQKVYAIERAAQAQGVKVYWLNYPQKKAAVASPAQQGS